MGYGGSAFVSGLDDGGSDGEAGSSDDEAGGSSRADGGGTALATGIRDWSSRRSPRSRLSAGWRQSTGTDGSVRNFSGFGSISAARRTSSMWSTGMTFSVFNTRLGMSRRSFAFSLGMITVVM